MAASDSFELKLEKQPHAQYRCFDTGVQRDCLPSKTDDTLSGLRAFGRPEFGADVLEDA